MLRWRSDSECLSTPDDSREIARGLLDVGRWRTLMMLGAYGPTKPQLLAKHTRLSIKDTVDHLVTLSNLGLVERDLDAAQNRWAHWKVIHGRFDLNELELSTDVEDQRLFLDWLSVVIQQQMMMLSDWIRDWRNYPSEMRKLANSEETLLVMMSQDDLVELVADVTALGRKWYQRSRENEANPDPNVEYQPAFLISHLFPMGYPSV